MELLHASLILIGSFLIVLGIPTYVHGESAMPQDLQEIAKKKSFVSDGQWTRTGSLGQTPLRVIDTLPLSDQENREGWRPLSSFSDEFDGDSLDEEKWWPYDPKWKGRQPGYFEMNNVTVADGRVNLWMRLGEVPEELRPEGYNKYSCSFLKSKEPVKYGYFEVRAKTGSTSSAFWFYGGTSEEWTEIDVFEIAGATPRLGRQYNMNAHVFCSPTVTEHFAIGGVWNAPWQFSADYHVYGLAWDEDYLRYYVDGVLVRAMKNTHWHQELYMCFDSETMPDWFGIPDDDVFPTAYSVDYVRTWIK